MEHFASLNGAVTGFHVAESWIDCICGKELLKLDKSTGEVIARKEVFEKEGLSRKLLADNGQIFVYDFCTFYVFSQEGYGLLGKWQLGDDLSSDICGMTVEGDTIYCSIRNGKLITLDRQSYLRNVCPISGSSMWSLKPWGDHLVCGTVDGRLLLLDKAALAIEKELVLGKKNIASLYIDGETLYAAGQDGKLFKISLGDFAVDSLVKNAHKKMFRCVGIWRDMLMTVSYPCSEIALWDKATLEKVKVLQVPLHLSGQAHIEGDDLYIASRNISGIDKIDLSNK